jgi:hypothetical protein
MAISLKPPRIGFVIMPMAREGGLEKANWFCDHAPAGHQPSIGFVIMVARCSRPVGFVIMESWFCDHGKLVL